MVGALVFVAIAWSCTLTTELPTPYDPPQSSTGGMGGEGAAGGGGEMVEPCAAGTKRCGDDCVAIDQAATGCAGESCEPCSLPNASAICIEGACAASACAIGFEDCDDDLQNGCEIDTDTDTDHCDGCGQGCSFPHAEATCVEGVCTMGSCEPGYDDCDQSALNGCEVNTAYDPSACDSCVTVCPPNGGTPICTDGACGVSSCTAPTADCDYDGIDCETNIDTSLAHCGFCNNPCSLTNAVASCQTGTCTLTGCNANKGNCDGNDFNGCETDLLVNASHCGACGKSCISGMCVAGRCKPLVLGDGAVGQLALDAVTVYFTTAAGVSKVKKTGGAVNVLSADVGPSDAIVLLDTSVYFATSLPQPNAVLYRVPQAGGSPTPILEGLAEPRRLATDGAYIYLTNHAEDDTGGVYRIDKAGDNPEILVNAPFASGLTIMGSHLWAYTTSADGNGLVELYSEDQGGTVFVTATDRPWGVTHDGTSFFWTSYDADRAVERSSSDGADVTKIAGGPGENQHIAVDATHVYWTAANDGLYRVVKTGGDPELLYTGGSPYGLALDSTFIYFVNLDTKQVLKLAK